MKRRNLYPLSILLILTTFLAQLGFAQNVPMLVKNIVSGSAGSNPTDFLTLGTKLYFIASTGTYNQLYQTDGTVNSTVVVAGYDAENGLLVNGPVLLNGQVYFVVQRTSRQNQGTTILLYKTNSTTAVLVDTLVNNTVPPSTSSVSVINLRVQNNLLCYDVKTDLFNQSNTSLILHTGQAGGKKVLGIIATGSSLSGTVSSTVNDVFVGTSYVYLFGNYYSNSSGFVTNRRTISVINTNDAVPTPRVLSPYTVNYGPTPSGLAAYRGLGVLGDVGFFTRNDTLFSVDIRGVGTILKTGVGEPNSVQKVGNFLYFTNINNQLWRVGGSIIEVEQINTALQANEALGSISTDGKEVYVNTNLLGVFPALRRIVGNNLSGSNGTGQEGRISTPFFANGNAYVITSPNTDCIQGLVEYNPTTNQNKFYPILSQANCNATTEYLKIGNNYAVTSNNLLFLDLTNTATGKELWKLDLTPSVSGQICASKGTLPWEYWVSNVKLGTINNTSDKFKDFNTLGFSDYTNLTTTLSKGQSYPLSISPGLSWIGNVPNAYARAWIDFNNNNIFEANELVLDKNNANPLTANVLVPTTAVTGNVRMRVSVKFGSYPTACETFDKGEVEDYTVNIQNGIVTTGRDTLRIVNVTGPDALPQGGTVTFNVTFKNTGTATSVASRKMGIYETSGYQGEPYAYRWFDVTKESNLVAVGQSIAPNATVTVPMTFQLSNTFTSKSPLPTEALIGKGKIIAFDNMPLGAQNYFPYVPATDTLYRDLPYTSFVDLPNGDLSVELIASDTTYGGDNVIKYSVRVRNLGTQTVRNVQSGVYGSRLADGPFTEIVRPSKGVFQRFNPYPGEFYKGNWTIGDMAAGETATCTVELTFANPAYDRIRYVGVGVQSNQLDELNTANNSATQGFISSTPPQYCASKGTLPWEQWIENVFINAKDLGKTSKEGYGNFTTAPAATVRRTQPNEITIIPKSSWNGNPINNTLFWRAWIDWNNDGDFNDANETIVSRPVVIVFGVFLDNNVSFSVPEGSTYTGKTRLRIAMKVGDYPTPCETFDKGEVEDYTVDIQGTTVDPCLTDVTPPVFQNCPKSDTIKVGLTCGPSGPCGGYFTWTPPTASDNCTTNPIIKSNYQPGEPFLSANGSVTVNYTATDAKGNIGRCTFTRTSTNQLNCNTLISGGQITGDEDQCAQPSCRFCPGNGYGAKTILSVSPGSGGLGGAGIEYIWVKNTTNIPNSATDGIVIANATADSLDKLSDATISSNYLITTTYFRRFARSVGCTSYVASNGISKIVRPITAPVLVCPNDTTITLTGVDTCYGGSLQNPRFVSTSSCDLTVNGLSENRGGCLKVGINPVTWTGNFVSGGFAQCTYKVTVKGAITCVNDVTPPVFTNCPQNQSIDVFDAGCQIFSFVPPSVTDNCTTTPSVSFVSKRGNTILSTTPQSVLVQLCPSTNIDTIVFTATDAKGNRATCSFTLKFVNQCFIERTIGSLPRNVVLTTSSNCAAYKWQIPITYFPCQKGPTTYTPFNLISTNPTVTVVRTPPSCQFCQELPLDSACFPIGRTILIYNRDTFHVFVQKVVAGSADLALSITSTPSVFTKYTTQIFKIKAQNVGSQSLTNVKIEFKRPAQTSNGGAKTASVGVFNDFCPGGIECSEWVIPTLAAGATATLDAPVFILDPATAIVATTKLLTSTPVDGNAANNSASVTLTPAAPAPAIQSLSRQKPTQYLPIIVQSIAPNPTEGDVVIEVESLKEQVVQFEFSNTMGQIIRTEKRPLEKGTNQVKFDVYEFSDGVYLIQTDVNRGRFTPTKFVKF
jgi:hypothetical protein